MKRVIDLSHPINTSTPPWPGTLPVEMEFLDHARLSTPAERHANSTRFTMNIHCATHMDAPYHFIDDGASIDQVPLEHTQGPATLIHLPAKGAHSEIGRVDLEPWAEPLNRTGKAIIHNGWSARWKKEDFFEGYPVITAAGAEFLVKCGVHLVGIEMASVDVKPNHTHLVLLANNVLIVECLRNLDQIGVDQFHFSATPLAFEGRDGSPVRAVAVVDE